MDIALITGSAGLIGLKAIRFLSRCLTCLSTRMTIGVLILLLLLSVMEAPLIRANNTLITQEIRYYMPEANEVYLVWGINGWQPVSLNTQPTGTTVDVVMFTPMILEGDDFVARIQVPLGINLDYGFQIREFRNNSEISWIWDGDYVLKSVGEKSGSLISSENQPVEVKGELPALPLSQAKELVGATEIIRFLLIILPIVVGAGFVITRGSERFAQKVSIRAHDVVMDCVFLSFTVFFSVILYVTDLGFYSDDWAFLGQFSTAQDQSLIGLFRTAYVPHVWIRPVQIFYLASLYWLFGSSPLGYHLINAFVFTGSVICFHLILRELGQRRLLAIAVPVVFALLPHYSTDRFWVAAFQANLSIVLYFLSLYSDLRALKASSTYRLLRWKLLSMILLLGSAFAYEVVLPLFLINFLIIWYLDRRGFPVYQNRSVSARTFLLFGNVFPLFVALAFKSYTVTRLSDQTSFLQRLVSNTKRAIVLNYSDYDYGLNFKRAVEVSYGDYLFSLPQVMKKILVEYPDTVIFVFAGMLGVMIFSYLYYVAQKSTVPLFTEQLEMLNLIAWGFVVFILGYSIFLTNSQLLLTPTGIGNRVAIAAAVGVAMSTVGLLGWMNTTIVANPLRLEIFCGLISLLCVSGFLINNTLATFWVKAYQQEQEILSDIQQQFPTLSPGSTLILDGVCQYEGPAIVFESNWDLAGALKMDYKDDSLRADVVSPNLKVKEDGLYTTLYGAETHYSYESKLFVYHFGRKLTYRLDDNETTENYFETYNPSYDNGCPKGSEGHGISVF